MPDDVRAIGALLAALVSLGACRHAAAPAPAPSTAAVAVAATDSTPAHLAFTIESRVLGESRPINVHLPAAYRAGDRARYPVLYMPDGGIDEDFPHVVVTIDSLVALGRIRPVIVVGIPNTQRRRDLTGPTRVHADSAIAPRVGGSAAFRRFLRDELMPAVERRWRTTPERGIVGESLAGLFIVETFFEEPALFTHYVALDPSLWWNAGALVDSTAARLTRMDAGGRTLVFAQSADDRGDQAARFARLLAATPPRGLRWRFVPRPELTHGNVFKEAGPAALAEGLQQR